MQIHCAGPVESTQCLKCCSHLHPVVGSVVLCTSQNAFPVFALNDNGPAASTGVGLAAAVSVDCDFCHVLKGMRFVDYVTIKVRSGRGGPGCVAFRREKHVPRGGPSGGDGGRGGSVLIEADGNLYTLLDLRYNRHHFAPNGSPGEGSNKTGRDGKDLVLRVPPGTAVSMTGGSRTLDEVVREGDQLVLVRGGRGGKGNAFFKRATRQVPRFAQPGEPGEEKDVTLELKMLADVGLVGQPNAGKSTLVSAVSAARPKIAEYPFTTLAPMPGVVQVESFQSFVIADIPGIIAGASEGKGLGLRFLRHIERNAVLLFIIPVVSPDPRAEYDQLLHELYTYDATMKHKPHTVAFSKSDLLPRGERHTWLTAVRQGFPPDLETHLISSVAREGLTALKQALWARVVEERKASAERILDTA